MDEFAISVNNVSKSFKFGQSLGISKLISSKSSQKTLLALDNVTFTVKKGEILGIIGLNGSGKTTLLRIIAGIYKPDHGYVQVTGKLSPLLQLGTGFQGDLDAKQNIIMNGMLLGLSKNDISEKVSKIIQYAELEKFENMKLKHFSSGMRARLAFATAMQVDPDILLVDEVLSVGDKEFQKKSYETFLAFTKSEKTIIHATHSLNKLSRFSDRILLLHRGKVFSIGKPKDVLQKYEELNPKN